MRTANHKNGAYGAGTKARNGGASASAVSPSATATHNQSGQLLTASPTFAAMPAVLIGSATILAPVRKRHARGMECLRDRADQRVVRSEAERARLSQDRLNGAGLSENVLKMPVRDSFQLNRQRDHFALALLLLLRR